MKTLLVILFVILCFSCKKGQECYDCTHDDGYGVVEEKVVCIDPTKSTHSDLVAPGVWDACILRK